MMARVEGGAKRRCVLQRIVAQIGVEMMGAMGFFNARVVDAMALWLRHFTAIPTRCVSAFSNYIGKGKGVSSRIHGGKFYEH
jgi:type 1 glutamine amidotransferase